MNTKFELLRAGTGRPRRGCRRFLRITWVRFAQVWQCQAETSQVSVRTIPTLSSSLFSFKPLIASFGAQFRALGESIVCELDGMFHCHRGWFHGPKFLMCRFCLSFFMVRLVSFLSWHAVWEGICYRPGARKFDIVSGGIFNVLGLNWSVAQSLSIQVIGCNEVVFMRSGIAPS